VIADLTERRRGNEERAAAIAAKGTTGRTRKRRFACGSRFYVTRLRHCDSAVMREHARANGSVLSELQRARMSLSLSLSRSLILSLYFSARFNERVMSNFYSRRLLAH